MQNLAFIAIGFLEISLELSQINSHVYFTLHKCTWVHCKINFGYFAR